MSLRAHEDMNGRVHLLRLCTGDDSRKAPSPTAIQAVAARARGDDCGSGARLGGDDCGPGARYALLRRGAALIRISICLSVGLI